MNGDSEADRAFPGEGDRGSSGMGALVCHQGWGALGSMWRWYSDVS